MSNYAFNTYTGNGSTTAYSITWEYLDSTHVKCFLDGVSTTAFTVSSSTVTFNSAPANSVVIRIERQTPLTARLVDFQDGSVLTESDLDKSANQNFYAVQEMQDDQSNNLSLTTADVYDAQSKRIINLADPTGTQDAVSKNYLENTWLSSANKTALTTVNANISNINAVNSNSSNINSAVSNATNINTVATNITSVNTVATDIAKVIAVANDLAEAVSEVETVADDLNEATSEIDTVATNIANVNTVGTAIANVNTVAGISANVTTVAGISANVTSVAGNSTNINAVNSNSANINTVAGAITNVNNVGGSITNVNTVATNLTAVNSFGNSYKVSASAPTGIAEGTLWFDTTNDIMKVYDGNAWANAGSSVNGTSQRYKFVATSGQTTFTGTDANGNTLTYDSGYIDAYLNGVHLDPSDYTATNGSSIVMGSATSTSDELYVVAFGTFNVASIDAGNITTGTLNDARLPTTIAGKTLNTAIVNANTLVARGDGSSADGKITLNCSQNSHGVSISSPNHASGQSYNLILPTSVGTNGQVLATAGSSTNQLSWIDATETKPTVADVSQTIAPATATDITITGTNFVSIPIVEFIKTDGSVTVANTVSFTSATALAVNVTLATGNYYVRIENPDGNAGRSTNNILTSSTAPTFSTSAGSLGSFAGNFSGTVATISGSSDSTIAYSETTSNLSGAGVTLNTSTGALTTTDFGGASTTPTTYNFTIRITDAEGQTADRSFSFTSTFGSTGGGQFN